MTGSDIPPETLLDIRKNSNTFAVSGMTVMSQSAGTCPRYNQLKKQIINYLSMSLPLLIRYLVTFKYSY
jgi:hypothetical protein